MSTRRSRALAADPAAAGQEHGPLFDLVNDGILVQELETGAILDANRRAEEMYGLGREELRKRTIEELSEGRPPYTLADARAIHRRAWRGEAQVFEWRARRASGELFWVEVNLTCVRLGGAERLLAVVRDIDERKRVHEALQESEARARRRAKQLHTALARANRLEAERALAVETLEQGDPVIIVDPDFRVVLINSNEELLARRSREDVVGQVLWDVFPEGASLDAKYWYAFHRVMERRVPESFVEYYRPLDLWTAVSVYPIRAGGIAIFIRDVSEQKRAEEELRQEKAFATRILSSSLNGIYVVDLERREHVFVNARYTQLTGYTVDDLRAQEGGVLAALFLPEDRPRMEAHLAALARARDGDVLDIEYRFRARDGRWITCFSRETPFSRGDDGRVRQLIGTFVDVTELRRAEESARASEARFRSLFETMTEGFALFEVTCDAEGRARDARVVEVNPAFERSTGIRRETVVGKLVSEVAPQERDHWVRTYEEISWTGRPTHAEIRSSVVDRDYEFYAFSPAPFQLAVLLVDITDRKRIEHELRDADRRKNEFLGVLSHELRTPLAPIRNAIYLLSNARVDSEQASRARHILLRQTEHLTRLVDDLLDVTRISRGKIALHRARIDAREPILRTCDDHRSVLEQHGLELGIELPPEPAWVDADPTRLAQVVGNLLQNAVKFTPPGGHVVVAAEPEGDRLVLRVRDTGIGMEPEDLERMFEPFAQADRSLARTTGGLGLGLALVKGLVELHGGAATARSEGLGRGTEIVVTLPLAPAPAAQDAGASPRPTAAGPRLVLVVEDNPDAGQSLADVLEVAGHRVRVAPDGRTGIALARELRPDVVLCDIGLPDMSGYDVARAIRSDDALRRTRLVALSGYALPEDRQRALEAGFDAHLAKPAEVDRLQAIIGASR